MPVLPSIPKRVSNVIFNTGALFALLNFFAAGIQPAMAGTGPPSVVAGKIRVQLLSDTLVRIEERGAEGFEDRPTFHVVNRGWPGTAFTTNTDGNDLVIHAAGYVVRVPQNAMSLDGVRVESIDGRVLYAYNGTLDEQPVAARAGG